MCQRSIITVLSTCRTALFFCESQCTFITSSIAATPSFVRPSEFQEGIQAHLWLVGERGASGHRRGWQRRVCTNRNVPELQRFQDPASEPSSVAYKCPSPCVGCLVLPRLRHLQPSNGGLLREKRPDFASDDLCQGRLSVVPFALPRDAVHPYDCALEMMLGLRKGSVPVLKMMQTLCC